MPEPSPLRLHQTAPLALEVSYDGHTLGTLTFIDESQMAAVREILRSGGFDETDRPVGQDATVNVETIEGKGTVYGADSPP